MVKHTVRAQCLLFFTLLCFGITAHASSDDVLKRLKQAYPAYIKEISSNYIAWKDGTLMQIKNSFPLFSLFANLFYDFDHSVGSITKDDVLHDTYEPFFRKMYGNSPAEVRKHLVTIYWMPHVFGARYPLKVTTINGVDKKLRHISAELEKLPPKYYKYLENPAGGFYWRRVMGESYLSSHSYGIAIDINSHYANYWLWDVQKAKRPLSALNFHNKVPKEIVAIFEKEGFFWGGRWYYYDTMHFEYRPELYIKS